MLQTQMLRFETYKNFQVLFFLSSCMEGGGRGDCFLYHAILKKYLDIDCSWYHCNKEENNGRTSTFVTQDLIIACVTVLAAKNDARLAGSLAGPLLVSLGDCQNWDRQTEILLRSQARLRKISCVEENIYKQTNTGNTAMRAVQNDGFVYSICVFYWWIFLISIAEDLFIPFIILTQLIPKQILSDIQTGMISMWFIVLV